jgi:hypothetical protein
MHALHKMSKAVANSADSKLHSRKIGAVLKEIQQNGQVSTEDSTRDSRVSSRSNVNRRYNDIISNHNSETPQLLHKKKA